MSVIGKIKKSYTFIWKIPDFLSLPITFGEFYDSPDFKFGRSTWCLRIFPAGDEAENLGWISLFLRQKISKCTKHDVTFTLSIKEDILLAFESAENVPFSGNDTQHGWPKFCERELLLEDMEFTAPDEVLTINLKMTLQNCVIDATQQTTIPKSFDVLQEDFQKLLFREEDCDVTLKVNHREFRAHRNILGARSPVFHMMFKHDTKERSCGVVDITDCDPDAFQDFLLHVYTGRVDQISESNVQSLYIIADKYGVGELKAECRFLIGEKLSVSNFCDVVALCLRHSESDLMDTAAAYFVQNMEDIITTDKWKFFTKQHPVTANDLHVKTFKDE